MMKYRRGGTACAQRAYIELWCRAFLFRRVPDSSGLSNTRLSALFAGDQPMPAAKCRCRSAVRVAWTDIFLLALWHSRPMALWPCGTQGQACFVPVAHKDVSSGLEARRDESVWALWHNGTSGFG